MNKTKTAFFIVAVYLSSHVFADDQPQRPSRDIPELAALQNLIGTFDTVVATPTRARGAPKGEWVHGGRFLRQTWTREAVDDAPGMNGTVIMTYDPLANVYRQWSFDSTGTVFESEGAWDPKTWTMTWTGSGAFETSHVWTMAFDKRLAHKWRIQIKDKNGETVYQSSGKTSPTKERELVYRTSQLATLGLAYHSYRAKYGKSPANKDELAGFLARQAKTDLSVLAAIDRLQRSEITMIWNSKLSKDGDINDQYRLAWESTKAKASLLMLTGGGQVKRVTPEELGRIQEIPLK